VIINTTIGYAFLMQIINRIVVNNEPSPLVANEGQRGGIESKESQPHFYTCPTLQIISVVVGMIGKRVMKYR